MIMITRLAIALAASWLAASTVTSSLAGPLPTAIAGLKSVPSEQSLEVRWRGYGPGIGFGFAAGALAGAAIAAPYYYGRAPGYFYGAPYYAQPVHAMPYAYAPVYAAPVYGGNYAASYGYYPVYRPGRCFTDEGYGRYRPCSAN
jgi:hypothetical protein